MTVFDFSEIMERTEKRVGDEVLGAGPQSVDELRAIARRVKSKYLLRIQSKEKHLVKKSSSPQKQLSSLLPTRESTKNVTNAVMGGVGGFATMFKASSSTVSEEANSKSNTIPDNAPCEEENVTSQYQEEVEVQYTDLAHNLPETQQVDADANNNTEDVLSEAFDLLGGDFSTISVGDIDHSDQELLDSMDVKLDPAAAFTIDDDDFKI